MKTKYVITLILGSILVVYFAGYINGCSREKKALQSLSAEYSNKIKNYEITVGDLTLSVAEKEQVVMSQREAIKRGDLLRETMRKLDIKRVEEIIKLNMRIDTLLTIAPDTKVVYVDTCTNNPRPALLLPFSFEKKDHQWLSLEGNYDTKGKLNISINMNVPLDIYGAVDKSTGKYKAVATTPNRYITITEINSDKLDVQKVRKWGIGFQVGYGTSITAPKLSPFIGIGLSRNIIRF